MENITLIFHRWQWDLTCLFAGLLPSDPDTASDAREQRQDQGGAEAGQDDDHRGASHLAVPLRRGMDEDRNIA